MLHLGALNLKMPDILGLVADSQGGLAELSTLYVGGRCCCCLCCCGSRAGCHWEQVVSGEGRVAFALVATLDTFSICDAKLKTQQKTLRIM